MTAINQPTTQDLGQGFFRHGAAAAISNHRGTAATCDGEGRDIVLVWLYDHRGGYSLLLIEAKTGKTEQFPTPFPIGGDGPFAALLSSRNRYYTHFNSHFVEFDANRREYTAVHETVPQMAMSMTEDDRGRIWSATYPSCGISCYDPESGDFRDFGHVYEQNWRQYPRTIAADDTGWIYFGIGQTASQIISLDPESGKATPLVPEDKRTQGSGTVYRDLDGKVYGRGWRDAEQWYVLHGGEYTLTTDPPPGNEKPIVTGSQGLFHRDFPSGRRLERCDLIERVLEVRDPATDQLHRVSFDYESEGPRVVSVIATTGRAFSVTGGTMFPMRCFTYDPATDAFAHYDAACQWNTITRTSDRIFVGAYTHGQLLEWDPPKPYVPADKDNPDTNPRWHTECEPTINRPHCLLAYDQNTVIMGGTPGYGHTGGGLLLWDRPTGTRTLLEHHDLLPEHAPMSLAPLPDGKLLVGSTTDPGTGGERKAEQAELYILNVATKRIEWHEPVIPGVQGYMSLCPAPNGGIYGIAEGGIFFVFDPAARKITHQHDARKGFGDIGYQQGPRKLIPGPDGDDSVYILFMKGIVRIAPDTHELTMLAESPVPIGPGGDLLDNRIYFASGSHIYSYQLP